MGTPNNDRLVSDPDTENNLLFGFAGDDVLIAKASNDILDGGLGDDTFYRDAGTSSINIRPGDG